ncbi:MAG: signal peptidase I [Synergistaceae bacterium]|nr:signal peptidase I [Synergistaceae bacterium]
MFIKTLQQLDEEFQAEYMPNYVATSAAKNAATNAADGAATDAATYAASFQEASSGAAAGVTAVASAEAYADKTGPIYWLLRKIKRVLNTRTVIDSAPVTQPVWKDISLLFLKIASIILVFVLLFTFLFGIVRFQEPSMDPAIKDGDLVIFYRYTKSGYLPQDVIALDYNGKRQVRRVVATAGDEVDITDEGLMINGAVQQEPSIFQQTERYQEGVSFPLTVPEGEVFVLGDSRTGITDSRIYGSVRIEDTLGKVMTVIRRRGI